MGTETENTGLQEASPATGGAGTGQIPQPSQPEKKKDRWDKAEIIGSIVGAILIPVALGIGSCYVSTSVQEAQTAAQMVVLGAEILRTEPDKSPKELRKWALDLIDRHAEPKLPKEARRILLEQGLAPLRVSESFQFEASKNVPAAIPLPGQTFVLEVKEVSPQPDGSHLVSFSISAEQQKTEATSVGIGYMLRFGEAQLKVIAISPSVAKFEVTSSP